jgi:hypothetical protein
MAKLLNLLFISTLFGDVTPRTPPIKDLAEVGINLIFQETPPTIAYEYWGKGDLFLKEFCEEGKPIFRLWLDLCRFWPDCLMERCRKTD